MRALTGRHTGRVLFRSLKVLLLAVVVYSTLKWCNQCHAARFLLAVAVVVGLRLLSEHVDVRKRRLAPLQPDSSSRLAAASSQQAPVESLGTPAKQPSLDSPRQVRQHRDHDAWRKLVGSELVATAWDRLCNSIIQEFIYDAWFSQLSPDREFPAEVRWQLNHAFGQACTRAKRQDWTSLLIRDCSAALCSTLQLYRSAVDAVGADALRSLPAAEADAAIRDVLSKARKLHPAFNRPDGQYRACKRLSEAVLAHLLPSEDRSCPMMRVMLRELFAACLLRSTLASLAPYSINKMLLNAMAAGANQKPPSKELLSAAAEFEHRGYLSSKAEQEHLSRQKTERQSRTSLLGAVSKAQESLALASRVFSNSMKRSKSLGDVKEAGSRSPIRAAVAAAVAWPGGSLAAAKQFGSRSRDSTSVSPVRGGSAMAAVGQQGQQMLLGSMGAVKAAAQQLSLRRRVGSDSRTTGGKGSLTSALGSSPSSLAADSPRSCTSTIELSSSPDLHTYYKVAASAAAAKAAQAASLGIAAGSRSWGDCDSNADSSTAGSSSCRSTAVGSSASSSATGSSSRSPMVAALCGLGRPPLSPTDSGGAAGGGLLRQQLRGRLSAQVASAEMLHCDGKDFIVYKVRVADDRGEWTVTRRYRHFEALHKRLRECLRYKDLPATLPPKRLLTARDAPFVMKRRDELDCYLQALLHSPCLVGNLELPEFLSQHSEVYGMAAAADRLQGIRPLLEASSLAQRTRSEDVSSMLGWRGVEPLPHNSSEYSMPQQQCEDGPAPCEANFTSSLHGSSSASSANGASGRATAGSQLSAGTVLGTSPPAAVSPLVGRRQSSTSQRAAGAVRETAHAFNTNVQVKSGHKLQAEQQPQQQQKDNLASGHAFTVASQVDYSTTMQLQKQPHTCTWQQQEQQLPPSSYLHREWQAQPAARPDGWEPTVEYVNSSSSSSSSSSHSVVTPDAQGLGARHASHRPEHGAAHVRFQGQPGGQQQQHCVQKPAALEQLDSADSNFFAQQSSAVPQLPSSPPVPNKILPEPSVSLDAMGMNRCPGRPRQLSRQESDAAKQLAAAAQQQQQQAQQPETLSDRCQQPRVAQAGGPLGAEDAGSNTNISSNDKVRSSPSRAAAAPGAAGEKATTAQAGVAATGAAVAALATLPASSSSSKCPAQQSQAGRPPAPGSSASASAYQAKPVCIDANSMAASRSSSMPPSPLRQGLPAQLQKCSAQCTAAGLGPELQAAQKQPKSTSSTSQPAVAAVHGRTAATAAPGSERGRDACAAALPPPGQAGVSGSGGHVVDDQAEWQDGMQDSTGLIIPLYELVSCAFELQNKGFVRRPVITLVRQLLSLVAGDAIDEFLQRALANGLSEESISRQLLRLQAQLWPGGVWFARAAAAASGVAPPRGPPITAERFLDWEPPADSDEVAEQVRQRLCASSMPAPLLALLGKNAYYKCLGDIYGVLQSKTLTYHLGLTVVETVLVSMFPEIKGVVRQMHQSGNV